MSKSASKWHLLGSFHWQDPMNLGHFLLRGHLLTPPHRPGDLLVIVMDPSVHDVSYGGNISANISANRQHPKKSRKPICHEGFYNMLLELSKTLTIVRYSKTLVNHSKSICLVDTGFQDDSWDLQKPARWTSGTWEVRMDEALSFWEKLSSTRIPGFGHVCI